MIGPASVENADSRVKLFEPLCPGARPLPSQANVLALPDQGHYLSSARRADVGQNVIQEFDDAFPADKPDVGESGAPRRLMRLDRPSPSLLEEFHDFGVCARQRDDGPRVAQAAGSGDRCGSVALKHARRPGVVSVRESGALSARGLQISQPFLLLGGTNTSHQGTRVGFSDGRVFVRHNAIVPFVASVNVMPTHWQGVG